MSKIGISVFTAPQAGGAYQYTRSLLQAASYIEKKLKNGDSFVVYSFDPLWEGICKEFGLKFSLLTENKITKALYHMGYIFNKLGKLNSGFYKNHPMWKVYDRDEIDVMIISSPSWYGKPEGKKLIMPIFDIMHRYIDFEEVGGGDISAERDRRYQSICTYADGIILDSKLGVMHAVDSYGEQVSGLVRKTFALPFIVPDYVNDKAEGEKVLVPEKYILYPAQFWKHKNHVALVKAAGELKEQGIIVNLVFTGTDKNAAEEIKENIEKYGLTEQVTNLGYVSDEQLVYLYRHARAMMFPSFGGPTNIPPLEAMALGCPVAVSNNFAMTEQVGKAGLSFAPDDDMQIKDCMRRLWLDDMLVKMLSENGIEQSKTWTVAEFAKELANIIHEVIA